MHILISLSWYLPQLCNFYPLSPLWKIGRVSEDWCMCTEHPRIWPWALMSAASALASSGGGGGYTTLSSFFPLFFHFFFLVSFFLFLFLFLFFLLFLDILFVLFFAFFLLFLFSSFSSFSSSGGEGLIQSPPKTLSEGALGIVNTRGRSCQIQSKYNFLLQIWNDFKIACMPKMGACKRKRQRPNNGSEHNWILSPTIR